MVPNATSLNAIREAAIAAYPKEACGVIVARGKKSVVVACRNIAERPECDFMIDPGDYSKAADTGEILAIWHTHTNGRNSPTEADLASCELFGIPWVLQAMRREEDDSFSFFEPIVFSPSGYEAPYLGRAYVPGVFDCYSILRDFYQREFGIKLNDYPRIESDGTLGSTRFVERYSQEGFVRVDGSKARYGDVFLIRSAGQEASDHIAIYLGDDLILHHCHGRVSKRDVYGGGYWQKHTSHHLRHKDAHADDRNS